MTLAWLQSLRGKFRMPRGFALLYHFLLARAIFTVGIANRCFWRLMTAMLFTDPWHLSEPGQGPPPSPGGVDPPVGLDTFSASGDTWSCSFYRARTKKTRNYRTRLRGRMATLSELSPSSQWGGERPEKVEDRESRVVLLGALGVQNLMTNHPGFCYSHSTPELEGGWKIIKCGGFQVTFFNKNSIGN